MQAKLLVGILAIGLGACAKEKPAEDKLTAAEAKSRSRRTEGDRPDKDPLESGALGKSKPTND